MKKSIFYLILNEITERYSLYGMRSILIAFMVNYLYFSEGESLKIFHLFIVFGYLFSILGGIIGDKYGHKKYQLLIILSLLYIIGHLILSFSIDKKEMYVGLGLIALCTGLIKPIIVSFVGDQFDLPKEQNQYGIAMNLLFLAVNTGSTMAMFLAPYLLHNYGPSTAFIVPSFAMIFSLIFFIAGKKHYTISTKKFIQFGVKQSIKFEKIIIIIVIFLLISIFFTLFDQMFSVVVLQAKSMDCTLFGFKLLPSQIPTINPILILIISPIFNFIYKYLDSNHYKINIFTKIQTGMIVASFAFVILCFIQYFLDKGLVVNIKWQVLAFIFITIAEVLIMPSSVEFAYSVAPHWARCKSISFFFFAICIGNMISVAIVANCSDKYMIFIASAILGMFASIGLFFAFRSYNNKLTICCEHNDASSWAN